MLILIERNTFNYTNNAITVVHCFANRAGKNTCETSSALAPMPT